MGLKLTSLCMCLFLLVGCDDEAPTEPRSSVTGSARPTDVEPSDAGGPEAEEEVLAAFETYRLSLLEEDPTRFAGILAQFTLDHYEAVRDLALRAPKQELMSQPLGDQIYAIFLRHVSEAPALARMDGAAIAEILVKEGAVSEGGALGMRAGEVSVSGRLATVTAVVRGGSTLPFTFRLETDGWKIDLLELAEGTELAFRQQMEQYGVSEGDYVLTAVEATSGSRPSKDIWQPLGP